MVKHILVETGLGKGIEEYGNMGDVSMLQMAVSRLQGMFPQASIEVFTDSVENLARYCPGATGLKNRGRALWFADGVLLGRASYLVPQWVISILVRCKRILRAQCPEIVRAILVGSLRFRNRAADAKAVEVFIRALRRANLLLICGAGGFYDGCRSWNLEILDLMEAAVQRNISVVMLGQGFGPLSDSPVLTRAAKILPRVSYITLRGGRGSLSCLSSLGVAGSNVETTGDEAVELAYESKRSELGYGLGINVRYAASATTDDDDVARIRPVVQDFARRRNVPLIPLPIAIQANTRDDLAIQKIMQGFDERSDGGHALDTPLKVIEQAARCRVVVTGAYHAAVFALAQGIPVVALAKSAYFSGKLLGLEDQFGEGCRTVLLNEPGWPQALEDAIEIAWRKADDLRAPLQAAARRQMESTRHSYERVRELVEDTTKVSVPAEI